MNLRRFIDPDRRWFASDKYQHGVSFYVLGFLGALVAHAALPLSIWQSAALSFAVSLDRGLTYEVGQTDTAYNPSIVNKHTGVSALGTPGFGISPLDLVWDYVGAAFGIGTWLLLVL